MTHARTYAETDIVATIEKLAGKAVAEIPPAQLDAFDQFHAGGPAATARLIPHLALTEGMTILDVGSGFGGPARQIARATGCTVIGVDITEAYVEAAQTLSEAAGLAEQTRFFHTDLTDSADFDRADFDAAFSIHVQMNVEDKAAFYKAIASRLKPGARLAVFDVCGTAVDNGPQPPLPLPWSLDGSDSHLVTADELRETIAGGGFDVVEWVDETEWVREWFDDLGRRIMAGTAPAALSALLDDGLTRVLNFAVAVTDGSVTVHRGVFRRSGNQAPA